MENKEFQPIDDLFSKLRDQETGPPSASWAQMESLLDSQENKKRRGGWLWWAVAAALVPLFLFSLILWLKPATESEIVAQQQIPKETQVPHQKNNEDQTHPLEVKAMPRMDEPNLVANQKLNRQKTLQKSNRSFRNSELPTQLNESETIMENAALVKNELKTTDSNLPKTSENQEFNQNVQQGSNPEEDQIARIEYHPSNPEQKEEESEVASIEILPDRSARARWLDTWNKIKNTDPTRLPVVEQTRDNLMAFLNFKKQ